MTYLQRPSSSAPLPLQGGPQEPDELTRFRNDWKHEVQIHHRADATHESSVDPVPPAHGPPAAQHYSAEELPQAQDSFVRLRYRNSLFPTLTTLCKTTIVDLLFGLHISEDTHDLGAVPKSAISEVVHDFPQTLTFDREEETEPIHITNIPDEVLVYILRFLDHGTIERFASISRKARVLTLDSTIWR
jgi:hypothetical protein